jgi:pimeloyl-ACP methyl ester carboxylesterase
MPTEPVLVQHRVRANAHAAMVFVHGFSGEPQKTWGLFLDLVGSEPALSGWDIHSVGYDTHLAPDIRGVWAADPNIAVLATFLRTRLVQAPLRKYTALALIAHSMGGLVVQRALLSHTDLAGRVTHVFLFGTPSAGLSKAGRFAFLKKSVKDMAKDGDFIHTLRSEWWGRFGSSRPFQFWTIAGARDDFVPAESSLDPFPVETRVVVIGDHTRIVKPENAQDMGLRAVCDGLVGNAAPGGPWNSALVAIEGKRFDEAIARLEPNAGELDDAHLIELALALDSVGRAADAVKYLSGRAKLGTDARGVLGGRLKRRWRAEGRERDGTEALGLYSDAFHEAASAGDHAQAYYHAVNVAYMELAFRNDPGASRRAADAALEHCQLAERTFWCEAAEGEARLHRHEFDQAVAAYRRAVALGPSPREMESMYEQAYVLAGLLECPDVQRSLDGVFRGEVESEELVDPEIGSA